MLTREGWPCTHPPLKTILFPRILMSEILTDKGRTLGVNFNLNATAVSPKENSEIWTLGNKIEEKC
jgi:hypothetical protein